MDDALYSVTEEGGGRSIRSFMRSNVVYAHLEHKPTKPHVCIDNTQVTVQASCKLEGNHV